MYLLDHFLFQITWCQRSIVLVVFNNCILPLRLSLDISSSHRSLTKSSRSSSQCAGSGFLDRIVSEVFVVYFWNINFGNSVRYQAIQKWSNVKRLKVKVKNRCNRQTISPPSLNDSLPVKNSESYQKQGTESSSHFCVTWLWATVVSHFVVRRFQVRMSSLKSDNCNNICHHVVLKCIPFWK